MKTIIQKTIINFREKYPTYVGSFPNQRSSFVEERLEKVVFESIEYISNDRKITGYIVSPKSITNKCAVIIYNKGGNNNQSFGGIKGDIPPKDLFIIMGYYAQHGYIVVASNYSGGVGSDGSDQFGGEDVYDVINLYNVIKEIKQADLNRIGMLGYSRGGMMTYLCMTKNLPRLKSCVTVGGSTDLVGLGKIRGEMYDNVYVKCFGGSMKEMKARSAIYFIDNISKEIPLLLLQGNADNKMPPKLALEFVGKAIDNGLTIRAQFYEGGDHTLTNHIKEKSETIKHRFNNTLQY